jgi:hypothetical protein
MNKKPSWQDAKRWSDTFTPHIAVILRRVFGQTVFKVSRWDDDAFRNTDMVGLLAGEKRIACRMRHHFPYLQRYGDQITIRSSLASGNKTEMAKILEGWGDLFFYGFANRTEDDIQKWTLGSYEVFRTWYAAMTRRAQGLKPQGIKKSNHADGDSDFIAFKLPGSDGYTHEVLPPDFVIASSDTWTG